MLKQEAIYNKAVAGRCIMMQRPFSCGFVEIIFLHDYFGASLMRKRKNFDFA